MKSLEPSNRVRSALLLGALALPLSYREAFAQELLQKDETASTVARTDITSAPNESSHAHPDKGLLSHIQSIEQYVVRLIQPQSEEIKDELREKLKKESRHILDLLDPEIVNGTRALMSNNDEKALLSLVQATHLFSRISTALFTLSRSSFPEVEYGCRDLSRILAILAQHYPEQIREEYRKGSFQTDMTETFRNACAQRDLYIYLAKNGPEKAGRPYLKWAWAAQIEKDIRSPMVFNEISNGSLFADTPRPIGQHPIAIYNYGFDLVKVVSLMSKDVAPDKALLVELWRYATHPSGVNGHVSLSAYALEQLAVVANHSPELFKDLLDTKDLGWGITPRQMIKENMIKPNRYSRLTDGKVGGQHAGFKALADAVGIVAE